jgi:hypothetical protein
LKGGKVAEKRALLVVKVNVVWSLLDEFNEYWERVNLPFWLKNGARHIGSFVSHLGAPENQIIRIFEFDSLEKCYEFLQLRQKMFDSEEGKKSLPNVYRFAENIEESVWISVY